MTNDMRHLTPRIQRPFEENRLLRRLLWSGDDAPPDLVRRGNQSRDTTSRITKPSVSLVLRGIQALFESVFRNVSLL